MRSLNQIKKRPTILSIWMFLLMPPAMAQQPTSLPTYSGTSVNFVRTWTATAPISDESALIQGNMLQSRQTTQYFDGLGRPLQTVIKKGSMTGFFNDTTVAVDWVEPTLYDEFGREQYKFMGFAANNAGGNVSVSDGLFKTNPYEQQQQFMNGKYASQIESNFYSQIKYEASPLNRVTEQFAPGVNWAGTAGQSNEADRHSIKTKYWINTTTDAVRIWTVTDGSLGSTITSTYTSNSIYPSGQLYKNVTVDEHNKQVIEFEDKEGKVLLKKVQLTSTADDGSGSGYDGWMCTYYIYDDLNNLRSVIQPEGVKALSQNGWQLTQPILDEQCFRYEYDERNRVAVKKVPGSAEVLMVYDVRDRLILNQDGIMRVNNMWLYTQYDALNRPVATGKWLISDPVTYSFANIRLAAYSSTNYTDALPGVTEELTRTFYDTYDWVNQAPYNSALPVNFSSYDNSWDGPSYMQTPSNIGFPYAQTNVPDSRTKGMVTGMRVKILNEPGYIYTTSIYDVKGRVIQMKSLNHTGGLDIATTQYSWSGQPLVSISRQQKPGSASITTVTKNNYDALGRVTQTIKNITDNINNISSPDLAGTNAHDELGQLKIKRLGVSGRDAVETQNYEYNIRGWLLGMNRDYVNSTHSNSHFGFDLAYDKPANLGGLPNYSKALYNGNITGMTWRGKTGNAEIRRYDYDYDAANRIIKADFNQYTSGSFNKTAGVDFSSWMGNGIYNDANVNAYDLNGNILSMTQIGLYSGSSQTIDQLTYTYNTGSNKLAKVADIGIPTTGLGDFKDGVNTDDDYAYDVNGNLIQDKNKDIQSITYNFLNLPETITVTGKGTIMYLYDAAGNKLRKTVNETGQPQKITNYVGDMVFEGSSGGTLSFIDMEDGRFRMNASNTAWAADFFLKDHLGNVRVVLGGTALEETHYYPFGLTQRGISYANPTSGLQNKYKFNGIEENTDLGLNQYDAYYRNLDPQIGRFMQIDPRPSHWESPYAAMRNDPIYFSDPLGDTTINGQYYENNVNDGTLEMVTVSNAKSSPSATTVTSTSSGVPNLEFAGVASFAVPGAFPIGIGAIEGIGTGVGAGASVVVLPAVLITAVLYPYMGQPGAISIETPFGFSPSDNTYFRPPNIIPPPPIPYRLNSEDNKQESDGDAKKPTPRTKSSKQLREEWEEATGQSWPKEPDNPNQNQAAHHSTPLADGGYDGYPNIEPKSRKDHVDHHKKNGDFKRWGSKRNK